MKLLKQTTVVFCTIFALSLTAIVSYEHMYKPAKDHYVLSNNSLRIINSHDIVIDNTFFMQGGSAEYVVTKQLMPFIFVSKISESLGFKALPIRVAFLSNGGSVDLYEALITITDIKDAYIICTIGAAQSIAFTYMMYICDERIILPKAEVMSHPVYYNTPKGSYSDAGTRTATIAQSDSEAVVLGIDKDEWYSISREQGDKYYTPTEMIRYGIDTKDYTPKALSIPYVPVSQ